MWLCEFDLTISGLWPIVNSGTNVIESSSFANSCTDNYK